MGNMSQLGHEEACKPGSGDGASNSVTRRNCCGAEFFCPVPMDEIATAIARCAGRLADSVATGESIDTGERRAIRYGGSSKNFFDR